MLKQVQHDIFAIFPITTQPLNREDEFAIVWSGCRPTWAFVRDHGLTCGAPSGHGTFRKRLHDGLRRSSQIGKSGLKIHFHHGNPLRDLEGFSGHMLKGLIHK